MSQSKALHLVFGIFGNATGLFLFLSPSVTFKRIIKNRSTEQFSSIPYVMTLLNCLLAAWYGQPFISPDNYMVSIINGIGVAIETVYVFIFIVFAPKKEKTKMLGLLLCILTIFASIASVSILALKDIKKRQFLSGSAAGFFSIIMYASPLSVMRVVIKTKSVEYMPFLLSLFVFLSATSWSIYGLLGNDKFLYIPNALGCLFGAMQLILYAFYRNNKGGDIKKYLTDQTLMEIGLPNPNPNPNPNPIHQK